MAGSLLKRFVMSVIPGSVSDGVITIRKDETICDVQCEYSKGSHETEIISYICLPCETTEQIEEYTCPSQVEPISTGLQDKVQGANTHIDVSLLADLCPPDTVVVDDVVNGLICCASTYVHSLSSVSTVVAESLRLEPSARDSDCSIVETQCEAQTQCESTKKVADSGYAPYKTLADSPPSSEVIGNGPPNCAIRELVLP